MGKDFKLIKASDTIASDGCRSVIVKFDGSKDSLINEGWLGNEKFARIFVSKTNIEIRIFTANESYVLTEQSKDEMVVRKYRIIKEFLR